MLGFEDMRRLRVCLGDKLDVGENEAFNALMWGEFIDRCAREYFAKWKKSGSCKLHVHRESLVKGSVIAVLEQVKPKKNLPLGGDVNMLVDKIQPFLQTAFDMPGPKHVTPTTLREKMDKCTQDIKAGVYDFPSISKHGELLKAFIAKMMTVHSRNGYPPIRGNVPGPDEMYSLSSDRVGMRRSKKASSPFSFLRHGAVVQAVLRMKNSNKQVVRVSAKNSPHATPWTNAADILWEFLAHYCSEEGVSQTSSLFVLLVNYVFYGKFYVMVKKKVEGTKNFLNGLHFKLTNGRTRYAKNCLTRFQTFTSHLAENPLWRTFFLDKGVGAPPVTYLADIEEGLRNYVDDPFTMGRDAMSSQAKWAAVEPWRKREAYITLIRQILKKESYRKWHDFRFTDLVERNNLHHTFKNRHLPLSDGDDSHFGGLITNPPHWSGEQPVPQKQQRVSRPVSKKKGKTVKKEVGPLTCTPKRFDPESGTLVDFVVIE